MAGFAAGFAALDEAWKAGSSSTGAPHVLLVGGSLGYIENMITNEISSKYEVISARTGEIVLIRLGLKWKTFNFHVADPEMTESSSSSSDGEEKRNRKLPKIHQSDSPRCTTRSSVVRKGGMQTTTIAREFKLPDLIICQLLPPTLHCTETITGLELLQRLKGNPKTKDIPFVMLLPMDNKDDMIGGTCLNDGATEVIEEPVSLEAITGLVKNLEGGG